MQLLKSDPEETHPTQLPPLRLKDSCIRVREKTARAWDKGIHYEIVFPRNVKSDTNNISPMWHLKHEQKKNNIRHAKEDRKQLLNNLCLPALVTARCPGWRHCERTKLNFYWRHLGHRSHFSYLYFNVWPGLLTDLHVMWKQRRSCWGQERN